MKQNKAQKRIVRKIQAFLRVHEYESGFVNKNGEPIKLHACSGKIDGYIPALCRKGVVLATGGGCFIERFALYPTTTLKRLLTSAKKKVAINK